MRTAPPKPLFILGSVVAVLYLLSGVVIGVLIPSFWEDSATSDRVFWIVLSLGGCLLLALGLWVFQRSPWPGAVLISLGAILGAIPLFWTLVALLLAIALVVLSVTYARRATGAGDAQEAA
jgi:hypothetical protein